MPTETKPKEFTKGQEVFLRAKFVRGSCVEKAALIFDVGNGRVLVMEKDIDQLLAPTKLDALEREALEKLIEYQTHPSYVLLETVICAVDKVLAARNPKSPAQLLADAWESYNPNAEDGSELTETLEEAIHAAVQALEKSI